jgi:hypothetical protein
MLEVQNTSANCGGGRFRPKPEGLTDGIQPRVCNRERAPIVFLLFLGFCFCNGFLGL